MKRIISTFLVVFLMLGSISIISAEEDKVTIYVSPTGSDDAAGTLDAPLKSFDGARKKVQSYISSGRKIEVVFRGGEYRLTESVNFFGEDSGLEGNPVVYKAYEDEKVEFKGSVTLDVLKAKRVTDEKILSRVYDDVKNKIVEIDLASCGITQDMLKKYENHDSEHNLRGGEVNGLYQNGNAQRVSEWPNGFGNYTTWDYAESGDTFHYTDIEPSRWKEARYMWVGGYNAYDYMYSRRTVTGIDTLASTITCYTEDKKYNFTSAQSRRWKAYNLIEEIDVPGEYYIDPDTMKLYWYPEETLVGAVVEFSWLNGYMLNVQHAQNLIFENLCFTQSRGTAIYCKQVNNVDFIGCEITDVGGRGMYIYSDILAETDKDYWQRNRLDGSYDCDILNCKFDNIGHNAIWITGGNVDTLTKSNNRIENNIITRSSQLAKNHPAIFIRGCGNIVNHNNISSLPFHAINIYGNDHTIKYNEIHDVIQESDDCGAIYGGRNTLHRGTEIAYNYIHDVMPVYELSYNFQGAIYVDDREGGYLIHHNIIENARIDLIVNGGVDIDYSNNISANIHRYYMRFNNGGIAENANTAKGIWEGHIADEELYFSHYKNLRELIEMGKTNTKDPRMAKFNKITGNLGVNCEGISIGTNTLQYGTVKNNVQIEECNDFVDSENGDFRIKKDSETFKNSPNVLSEDFDISLIGVQKDYIVDIEKSKFSQICPKNGQQGINSAGIDFVWQSAKDATSYRLVIASDPELKNVVYDDVFYYTTATVEGLENNKIYYWKVWAENNSIDYGSKWGSTSPVYSFETSLYETLDTKHLNLILENTKQTLKNLDVGEKPGQYPAEITDKVTKLVKYAEKMTNARLGRFKQKSIDSMANILSSSFNAIGLTNIGYIDLSEYFTSQDNWTHPIEKSEDGSIVVSKAITGSYNQGINNLSYMAGSVIYSFDAKLEVPSGYVIFGINKDCKINPYAATNTGYSFLFKQNSLELHVTNGTTQTIAETVEHNFANDGKYHKIQYGYVNTDIGNIVLLYVDGKKVIEYLDVINPAVNVMGTFTVHLSSDKVSVRLKGTENIGDDEKLGEIVNNCLLRSAKTIIDKYEDGVIVMQENSDKIFTPTGVYDTEGVITSEGVMMMPADAIYKVFGAETSQNGNILAIKYEEKNITFSIGGRDITVDGVKTEIKKGAETYGEVVRVPVEALLTAMELTYTYSTEQGLIIVGDIIFMNNLNNMKKTSLLMDMMKDMPEFGDYIFAEYK